jgi:hypothetical protein
LDADVDTTNNNNHCEPLCAADSNCEGTGAGYGCNPWSHLCELKDQGLTKYGGACTADAQCESNRCSTNKPGGYCTGLCSGTALACGGVGVCYYSASYGDNVGYCFQGCASDATCRTPTYHCRNYDQGLVCWCGAAYDTCDFDWQCCSGSCGWFAWHQCDY